jgi:RNA polymerase sigma-70 factor (ECF subfamily)
VAEDVVQETFFQIWNKASLYDPSRGTLGSWVIRVARNRAIDHLRSAAGRMSARTTDLCGTEAFPDGGDAVSNLDARRRVEAAFHKLNPNQMAVIRLAYYEGMSQSEMASHLNQPLGTVKTLVRSALRILREELA